MPLRPHSAAAPRWAATLAVLGLAVLPFLSHPFRFEQHETHRLDVLIVLFVLALLVLGRPRFAPDARPLVIALAVWFTLLILSSLVALSPSRAIMGDLVRRMGLLSQLGLAGAFLIGLRLRAGHHLWVGRAILFVAAWVVLEALFLLGPTARVGRPPGPFGSATFTGGWLALALLWVVVGAPGLLGRHRRRSTVLFALAALVALILTASRGAVLGLAAGAVTATLLTALWARRSRWLVVLLIAAALATALILFILFAPFEIPFLSRFRLESLLASFGFRQALWADSQRILAFWPSLVDVHGVPDRWAALRPWLGYGPEMFEAAHRLYFTDAVGVFALGQRIDRAHNLWLDTAITTGWAGLVAQVSIFLTAWVVGLRRAGLRAAMTIAFPLLTALAFVVPVGLATRGLQARALPFIPLLATLGLVAGVWLLLALQVLRRHSLPARFDRRTLLALTILTAHLVDQQFSFASAATGWPVWLALGLLCAPSSPSPDTPASWPEPGRWLSIAVMFLLRLLVARGESPLVIGVLLAALVLAAFVDTRARMDWGRMLLFGAFGVAGALVRSPWLIAAWDVAALLLALWTLAPVNLPLPARRPASLARLAVVALAGVFLLRTIAADVLLRQGLRAADPQASLTDLNAALRLRAWDDRLTSTVANALRQVAMPAPDLVDETALRSARDYFLRAADLNGFEADTALSLGIIETRLALADPATGDRDRALAYFARATALWPYEAATWRERGRATLLLTGDVEPARAYLSRATALNPSDLDARQLLVSLERSTTGD